MAERVTESARNCATFNEGWKVIYWSKPFSNFYFAAHEIKMHIFSLEKRHNGGKKQIWRWQFLLTRIDSSLTVYSSLLEVEGGFSCAIHCASWTCSGFAILLHFVWKKYHLFGINNYLFINVDGCWYIQNQLGGMQRSWQDSSIKV